MEKTLKEKLIEHPVLKDSFGGVMYDLANQDKYDTKELLEIWGEMTAGEKDSCDGTVRGAMDFILGNN